MSEAKSKASSSSCKKKKPPPSKQKPSQVSKSAVVKGSQTGKKASAEAGKKKSTSCKSSKKMEKKSKVEEEGEGEGEGEKEKQMGKEGGGDQEEAAANSSKAQSKKAATPPINSQYEVPVLSKVVGSSAPPVQPPPQQQQLHDPKAVMATALTDEERAKKIEKNRQAVESIISMLQSIPPDNISPETRDDLIVIHGIAKGILARYVPLAEKCEKSSATGEEGVGGGEKGSSKTEDKEEEDFKLEEVKSGKDAAE
ncbi:hypothetical protein TYRP_009006 [Tyrophagus putrescentiae]|nr:hypothetical protein TYRP_009006 [Tyrophagus putrescentiae]